MITSQARNNVDTVAGFGNCKGWSGDRSPLVHGTCASLMLRLCIILILLDWVERNALSPRRRCIGSVVCLECGQRARHTGGGQPRLAKALRSDRTLEEVASDSDCLQCLAGVTGGMQASTGGEITSAFTEFWFRQRYDTSLDGHAHRSDYRS
ncbi:hypothetical protein OG21DRAFT_790976 [Imleria badia]|nr:hypothetical protein OG21DRAFT_790976 [Imleria badia]